MLLLLRKRQAMVLIALMLQPCELKGDQDVLDHLSYDPEGREANVDERTLQAVDVVLCHGAHTHEHTEEVQSSSVQAHVGRSL